MVDNTEINNILRQKICYVQGKLLQKMMEQQLEAMDGWVDACCVPMAIFVKNFSSEGTNWLDGWMSNHFEAVLHEDVSKKNKWLFTCLKEAKENSIQFYYWGMPGKDKNGRILELVICLTQPLVVSCNLDQQSWG